MKEKTNAISLCRNCMKSDVCKYREAYTSLANSAANMIEEDSIFDIEVRCKSCRENKPQIVPRPNGRE